MSFHDLTVVAYAKIHELMKSSESQHTVPSLGFEYSTEQPDFIYQLQEADFTRELVNAFNQYAYWLARLALWERVLNDYSEADAKALRYEFTKLPLDHCLQFPYQFKSRLIFCATQLCYTKAISAKIITKEQVKLDDQINFGTLMAVAKHWPSGTSLVETLKTADGKKFRESTFNYRNKAQHRHSQRLYYGYIANIVRTFPDQSLVSYSFGQAPPIMATDVLPALATEAEALRTAFFAYRALVEDHAHAKSET
jgi:hypothetical protein